MEWIVKDESLCVCIKPAGVLSTDEPGGMPSLVREALGDPGCDVRTVHRLDQVVSGLMLLARTPEAASALSSQIREQSFGKAYLAVIHGIPDEVEGTLTDLLLRDRSLRKTLVVTEPQKGAQEAVLDYKALAADNGLSLLRITLRTGRTHQIRVQFSSRGLPLLGDKKYGLGEDCNIALWSYSLRFRHPDTGAMVALSRLPPDEYPWNVFPEALKQVGAG